MNQLTKTLRAAGYTIRKEPKWTDDGYYESSILDPCGNKIKLTS